MAPCGIARIDGLLAGQSGIPPIGPGDPDKVSVGVIQDLLVGHGGKLLPNLLSPSYGTFGSRTAAALANFCSQQGLAASGQVDTAIFRAMVQTPAPAPIACRGYLTLVLDHPFTGLTKIVSLVAQMEGAGKFAALNLNTDKAGLSFGLIQWAQKPGRLAEILPAFQTASSEDFTRIFGAGDTAVAKSLITHVKKASGGVSPTTGKSTNAAFDLIEDPWVSRFEEAGALTAFQKVQVETALQAFGKSLANLRKFASGITTERGIAFMLDLANQFGDAGAKNIFRMVQKKGVADGDLLVTIAAESVRRMAPKFRKGTQARRQSFLTTTFLSDAPFEDSPTDQSG